MEASRGVSLLRVALYGRVSTLDKGQDVNLQLNELREYSEHRGWKIAGEYVDNGVSGAKESRPELNRLLADAKRRKFDAIAVWKLDRFGRSLKHLVMTLADLESLGIAFVSLRDGFDLSTASGRLMFQIIGAMGEFERNLIRERVRAGMAHAKAKLPAHPLDATATRKVWRFKLSEVDEAIAGNGPSGALSRVPGQSNNAPGSPRSQRGCHQANLRTRCDPAGSKDQTEPQPR